MANRETQVVTLIPEVGSPNVRATQVVTIIPTSESPHIHGTQVVRVVPMSLAPNVKGTQVVRMMILPNDGNSTPPGGTLQFVQEFTMP